MTKESNQEWVDRMLRLDSKLTDREIRQGTNTSGPMKSEFRLRE